MKSTDVVKTKLIDVALDPKSTAQEHAHAIASLKAMGTDALTALLLAQLTKTANAHHG